MAGPTLVGSAVADGSPPGREWTPGPSAVGAVAGSSSRDIRPGPVSVSKWRALLWSGPPWPTDLLLGASGLLDHRRWAQSPVRPAGTSGLVQFRCLNGGPYSGRVRRGRRISSWARVDSWTIGGGRSRRFVQQGHPAWSSFGV